ncbi:hypothetical protein PT974_02868 [Cladobotryum mycophilum]|uniref:Uncharacterized protein n=1 Tax=Cladobotryum mycophilum TaxID=491253 RepID=A0ABR0T0H5_9HYPO
MNTHSSPYNEDAKRFDFHSLDFRATFQVYCLEASLQTGYVIHPEAFPRINELKYQGPPSKIRYDIFTSVYEEYGGNLGRIPAIEHACKKTFDPDFDPQDWLLKMDPKVIIHFYTDISW